MCSMISAQCDRLRERAKSLRQGRWSDGEDDATLMERAADTIWELRNKLSGVVDQQDEIERLKAENAKLREERDEWHRVAASKQDIIDHMRDARAENARLRELVLELYHELDAATQYDAGGGRGVVSEFSDLMRELGIEVE